MTVYVMRDGILVEKANVNLPPKMRGDFTLPMISRLTPFESPVDGREITSWRERDRDMAAVGAVDPRDLPQKPFEERRKANARNTQA
jgi:hypothetical protein